MILERIQSFIDKEGLSIAAFERSIGASSASMAKALKTGKYIGSDKLENILRCYPRLSPVWLMTGEGEMYKSESNSLVVEKIHTPEYTERLDDRFVNLYDISAAANLKTLFENQQQNIIGQISIPDIPDCDGAVNVTGDSMYPLLKSGDIIAFKALNSISSILYGEIHLVSYNIDDSGFLAVKYVKQSTKPDHVQLVSYNSHHDPMDIPKDSIDAIAIVKFSIRRHTMR